MRRSKDVKYGRVTHGVYYDIAKKMRKGDNVYDSLPKLI